MSSTKKMGILILSLAVLAVAAGTVACQKEAVETSAEVQKGVAEFDGTVLAALGRYMYLSTAPGFDIVVPGFNTAPLKGKTVKVKGRLLVDHPPIFLADGVEAGPGATAYTRSQEFQEEDFIEMKVREAVPALAITGVAKSEEWEGKPQGKVYGKLEKGEVNRIVLYDAKGMEMAKIIVDSMSIYASYYLQKLRLFDKFWFYLDVKDTVDRRVRTRTKEIFNADVVGVGLY
jgi:hypothetical protein